MDSVPAGLGRDVRMPAAGDDARLVGCEYVEHLVHESLARIVNAIVRRKVVIDACAERLVGKAPHVFNGHPVVFAFGIVRKPQVRAVPRADPFDAQVLHQGCKLPVYTPSADELLQVVFQRPRHTKPMFSTNPVRLRFRAPHFLSI